MQPLTKGACFSLIDLFSRYGRVLVTAMGQTLLLALYGLFFACIIGLIVGIMSVVKNKVCRGFALVFVNLIRGVPMIVLAYFIFLAFHSSSTTFCMWRTG